MNHTLAIDQGTHATRVILFDQHGNCVASEWREVDSQLLDKGYIEQNPQELLDSIHQVISTLLGSLSKDVVKSINACGICTQRSTLLAMDHLGNPLTPALSWQDTRGADFLTTLKEHHQSMQTLSGLPVSAHYGASKFHWLLQQQHHPKLHDKHILLAPLISFLLFNLVDEKQFCVDHTNAQRTQLMDINSLGWSASLLKWFQIPREGLPTIKPMCSHYGSLKYKIQNRDVKIPITAVCGDQNAAIFGSGNLPNDMALVNLGSGAFVLRRLDKLQPSSKQLSGVCYSDSNVIHYLREGTINGAASALSWANERFDLGDLKQQLPDWLNSVENPPVFINSVGGLGSPWWNADIEPQWVGLVGNSKAEIAVSIIESIVFLMQDNLSLMQQEKPILKLRVSGGLSNLDGLCQRLANLSQLPVERMDNPEATARGVAWLAAGKLVSWEQTAVGIFQPKPDSRLHQRYQQFCKHLAFLIKEQL